MDMQQTIKKEITLEGVGLHTGNMTRLVFKPAPVGTGIRFVRTDLPGKPVIPATYLQVMGTAIRGTSIGNEPERVYTVEHILASCSGLGIDNLEVELTNNEPPILDGSARLFTEALLGAGLQEQNAAREYLTVTEPVTYQSGETVITAYPSDSFSIECAVTYDHPFIKNQQASFTISRDTFVRELAPARTFCFDYEIEALKSSGLAKGGDFSNAIVVGLNGIHNKEPLRFADEFVRHKLMDLIGDLYLLGKPIKARITAVRCGHNHNVGFVAKLAAAARPLAAPQPKPKLQEVSPMSAPSQTPGTMLDIVAIQKIIPHRYPFLLIDRVRIDEPLKRATGFKCVSGNEGFFQGHFPGQPVMPGVLIIESMAQTACVMFLARPELKDKLAYFMAIDGVKFRKTVAPGDVLELRIDVIRARDRGGKVRGEAYVNNALVTEAEFMFAIVEKEGSK